MYTSNYTRLPCYNNIDHQNASTGSEIHSVAPGENKHPVSFVMDKHCEELAFPVLFPKGR